MKKHHPFRLLPLLLLAAALLLPGCGSPQTPTPLAIVPTSPQPSATQALSTLPMVSAAPTSGGLLVLSMTEGGVAHLFTFSPAALEMTRLTADPWDDITPAISPDGSRIAFASRRNGYWDLYLLELASGEVSRVTDTPEYEGAPSWSPDGQWLVYECTLDDNLEICIRTAGDPAQAAIRLTNHIAADHSPAWAPGGRQVAFVSNRSGQDDIWLADLDIPGEERYHNLSNSATTQEAHPAWSPDGTHLAWSAVDALGAASTLILHVDEAEQPPLRSGAGSWAVWQDDSHLLTVVQAPNQYFLSSFSHPAGELTLALTPLQGTVLGLTWLPGGMPSPLAEPFRQAAAAAAPVLYTMTSPDRTGIPSGRASLVELEDVQTAHPQLHDNAVASFNALRAHLSRAAGWDVLSSLANAYVPLTSPLDPGMGQDWLYSGRAFAINPLLANAGWLAAVAEADNGQTYWRLYVRTLAQDGSQGIPLHHAPWDFNARYSGDPALYDQGGAVIDPIPSGYWLDLTALAAAYGWERLPALPNWRTFAAGSRFTEFAFTQGLDWYTAMLELYPPEALITPTVVIPPTRTPTATPWYYRTPTPSITPSPRPTLTPVP